jgi:arabinogalactan oligomer/maltooligosaccharide transport system permease protein
VLAYRTAGCSLNLRSEQDWGIFMANRTKGTVAAAVSGFFKAIGGFFSGFGTAVAKGDLFVKLSLLWWGAGYVRRKQYVKAVIMTALEAAVILFTILFAMDYVPKFGSLGTVQAEKVFNMDTMKSEFNDYDHSFKILLFSLFSFVVWFAAIIVWIKNVINVYKLQKMEENGEHINTFREDMKTYIGERFHITLLTLPVLGIVVFTLIPILLLVFVAFTNYDQNHMPPSQLFSWVGFKNFITLFGGGGLTSTFGYAFVRVLGWTLVWALFSTLTTYIGQYEVTPHL